MSRTRLSRDADRELWVETRLKAAYDEGRIRTTAAMLREKVRLNAAYNVMTEHRPPELAKRSGQRLSERDDALFYRGPSR